jgi:hypothetical protein
MIEHVRTSLPPSATKPGPLDIFVLETMITPIALERAQDFC